MAKKNLKEKKQVRGSFRFKLDYGLTDKLDRFYKKWKKKCIFGKYPDKARAYDLIISNALDYMDANLPAIHKRQELELKDVDKQLKEYKKSKRYKEDMKWMKNRKRIELPSSRRKANARR